MFVVIGGGGHTGARLASFLIAQSHEVRLIEPRAEVLAHLHRDLPTEAIMEGSATDPRVLAAADVSRAAVVAACMASDAESLALCHMARVLYSVPRTIACINNPRNAWLFDATFHVDVALDQSDILAKLIEQEMSLGEMMTLLKLRRGRFSLVSEKLPSGSRAAGLAIKDLPLPANCVIAAILRKGEIVIPRGPLAVEVGDEILAIVDAEGAPALEALFGHLTKEGKS